MSKWTPGPWHIDCDGSPVLQDEAVIVRCAAGYRIAEAWEGFLGTNEKPEVRDALANARLIAAAPEMIDELKALCLYFGCVGVDAGYTEQEDEPCGQCRTCLAQKVIEKAEGA